MQFFDNNKQNALQTPCGNLDSEKEKESFQEFKTHPRYKFYMMNKCFLKKKKKSPWCQAIEAINTTAKVEYDMPDRV